MVYPQLPTHYPAPEPPHRTPVALIVVAVVAAVAVIVLGAAYVGYRVVTGALAARQHPVAATTTGQPSGPGEPAQTTEPEPTGPAPTGTGTAPETVPTAVGLVDVTAVAGQGDAEAVAEMFDSYFRGIDDGDIPQALAEYDPAGVVDPADPDQASQFARAVATTRDDGISLVGLGGDPTGRGAVQARVTFTSHQAAGYGPASDPEETCTRWDVTYILTYDRSAGYRILDNARHDDEGC